ncbi:ATP-binding cassette domain-containing protein [Pseudanabaena sp. FACHB-1998]|uniref:ABC transporter ATP-binding protein n=1 Tax=Pseudanabaena sp. FACHB-1998 TaxID=2692858 RepID=UPI0016803AE6|nr:energy-coupling factor transporter ATPase [Pseudanabaena sp. FACHB-1998]MBD2176025.1 ATP-binding cassette domain-containing protein [Pseudanabaena sp. FACHB-1998]
MEAIAVLDKVSYIYPNSKETVLQDISLTIHQGEFLGIIGATGAGKTTLCLALTGIVPQFYGGRFFGKIAIAGLDSLDHPVSELARHVGIVFEDPEVQITATSVENEIAFALENLCVPREEILRRIPSVLKSVRLEGFEKKNPQDLSGGQKQRLAIAAALALQPDLLILDEPTSQLDPIGSQEVFATVRELKENLGVAIVMVSHAAEEMAEFCDRIALLSEGKLLAIGTPSEIYGQVDLLHQNKLRPPEVAQAFSQIQQKGIELDPIPVTLASGLAVLGQWRSQGHRIISPNLSNSPNSSDQPKFSKPPILSVKNLQHTYADGMEAIKNISLDIQEGEYVLIVGQNGAGKSTLVKHFLNLLKPTSGQVFVGDRDTCKLSVSELAQSIGYLAQNPDNQIFNTSVEKEVSFALPFLGYAPEAVKQETARSLQAMGLWENRHAHPLSLPKGERGRIVIAALLAMNPDIIIFDEPTTGQDYQGASSILEVSRQLHQMGKTVIVITHHLYLMPDYADRAIVMGKGTILLDAPLRQAYHQVDLLESTYLTPPQSVFLSQYLSKTSDRSYPLITPTEFASCFAAL